MDILLSIEVTLEEELTCGAPVSLPLENPLGEILDIGVGDIDINDDLETFGDEDRKDVTVVVAVPQTLITESLLTVCVREGFIV